LLPPGELQKSGIEHDRMRATARSKSFDLATNPFSPEIPGKIRKFGDFLPFPSGATAARLS
jgi:hypothetical protein